MSERAGFIHSAVVRILAMNVLLTALLVTLLAVPGGVIWRVFIGWGVLTLCATWSSGVTQQEVERDQ